MGVFHSTFSPVAAFQVSGRFCFSAMPSAWVPLNEGQGPLPVVAAGKGPVAGPGVRTMRRGSTAGVTPFGSHALRSTIIRRGVQSSETSEKLTR